MKFWKVILMSLFVTGCSCVCNEQDDLIVAAYVWPSCHDDSLARKWIWPEGIGEWEVIKQGDPRFPGHYQPRQPLFGYEMDNDPVVVEKWINTALEYGVNTFIYDWYWYKDPEGYNGEYLESALNDGFLKAPSNRKMNFCIMWANHDVRYNYWNCRIWKDNRDRLFNPDVTWDDIKVITDKWVDNYFSKDNYLRIDGKPVLMIFSFSNLVRSFGSMAEVRKVLDYIRAEAKKAGHEDLYIVHTEGGGNGPVGIGGQIHLICLGIDVHQNDAHLIVPGLAHSADASYIQSSFCGSITVRDHRQSITNGNGFPVEVIYRGLIIDLLSQTA